MRTNKKNDLMTEITELKQLFDQISQDTEEFLTRAKKLSKNGVSEVKHLVDAAKSQWQIVSDFFGGSKKITAKDAIKKAKKVANVVRKNAMKVKSKGSRISRSMH